MADTGAAQSDSGVAFWFASARGLAGRWRAVTLAAVGVLAVFAALGAVGCARPFPADQVPKMKLLIMDFELAPGLRETPQAVRGWWLGASTIHQNPRAGVIFAERLTAHMAPLPFVNLYTRVDLKYYFARKRQQLRAAYDYLDDDEIDELMRQAPALGFARELGADKVLTGRIVENYLDENRTVHWWSSTVHVQLQVTDVLSGEVEWEKELRAKKWFASQFSAQDEVAAQLVEDMKEEYFRPLTVAAVR